MLYNSLKIAFDFFTDTQNKTYGKRKEQQQQNNKHFINLNNTITSRE